MATETTQEIEFVEINPPRKIEMFPSDSKQQLRQQIIYSMEEVKFKFHNLRLNTLEQRSYYIYPACHGRFILIEKSYRQHYCKTLYYIQKDGSIISFVQTRQQSLIYMFSNSQILIREFISSQMTNMTVWNLQHNILIGSSKSSITYKYREIFVFPRKRLICFLICQDHDISICYCSYQNGQEVIEIKQYQYKLPQSCIRCYYSQFNNEDGFAIYVQDKNNQHFVVICDVDSLKEYKFPLLPNLQNCQYQLLKIHQVNKGILMYQFESNYTQASNYSNTRRRKYNLLFNHIQNIWSDSFPINGNNVLHYFGFFREQLMSSGSLTPYHLRNAIFIDYQNLQILGSNKECNFDGFVSNPVYDETLFTYLDYSECDLDAQVIPMTVRTVKFNKLVEICTFLLCELIPNIDVDILSSVNKLISK